MGRRRLNNDVITSKIIIAIKYGVHWLSKSARFLHSSRPRRMTFFLHSFQESEHTESSHVVLYTCCRLGCGIIKTEWDETRAISSFRDISQDESSGQSLVFLCFSVYRVLSDSFKECFVAYCIFQFNIDIFKWNSENSFYWE